MQNRLLVGEGVESELSTVAAHPGDSDSSERKRIDSDMHQNVVDSDTSTAGFIDESLDFSFIPSEDVGGQWFLSLVDVFQSFRDVFDGDNRKNGAKDLIVHEHIGFLDVENSWVDEEIVAVTFSADQGDSFGFIKQLGDSAERNL